MIIHLNGIKEIIPEGMTINSLIEWAKEGDPHVIVERNGRYIYPSSYDSQSIFENDVIEFINPNLGG